MCGILSDFRILKMTDQIMNMMFTLLTFSHQERSSLDIHAIVHLHCIPEVQTINQHNYHEIFVQQHEKQQHSWGIHSGNTELTMHSLS